MTEKEYGNEQAEVPEERAELLEKKLIDENKKAGATVYSFDADSSPQDKQAAAAKNMPPALSMKALQQSTALITDMDDDKAPENWDLEVPNKAVQPPEAVAKNANKALAEDSQAGWRQVGKIDEDELTERSTWLEKRLPDIAFGQWWHNAIAIVLASLMSWLVARLGGGLIWVAVILAFCSTYYNTSLRRLKRNARDDIARTLAKQRLETESETMDWMNSFVAKFWLIYEPVLAAMVISNVDEVLSTVTPSFLESLRLSSFTLGTKPPRVEHVKTHPKSDEDTVLMDWKFSFTPNDTDDLTSRQLKTKVNPKVVLKIRVGKGIATKAFSVLLEDMSFSGLMRVKIKLMANFPHVQTVEVCFLEKPEFDYVLKPLGGDTFGFDIGFIPGLSTFIAEQVHANLGPMLYAPNVFTINVQQLLAGAPIDTAIGVVVVTIYNAVGLKNTDRFGGCPDPFAVFMLNGKSELARTEIKRDTSTPRWNETKYLLVTSLTQSLMVELYDFNEYSKNKSMGIASFDLQQLEDTPEVENMACPVILNGKERGQVYLDVRYFPVLESKKLEDGTVEPAPESNTGVVRFKVHQASDLDVKRSKVGELSPYAIQYLNKRQIHVSTTVKRSNAPKWNDSFEFLVMNRKICKLGVIIRDKRDFSDDPVIGKFEMSLDDLMVNMEKNSDWFNLSDTASGRVKLSVVWKPIAMTGIGLGSGGYITPIGVLRIHFRGAKDLKNYEVAGKADPYVRVLSSGVEQTRTVTIKNTQNPDWNEILYVQIRTGKETLKLEVLDYQAYSRDRTLGSSTVKVEDFAKRNDEGLYLEDSTCVERQEPLNFAGQAKGVLMYNVSFYPCLNVEDAEEEENKTEKQVDEAAAQNVTEKPTGDADEQKKDIDFSVDTKVRKEKVLPKIKVAPEDLVKYNHGVIIFRILEGELAHKGYFVEVVLDDLLYPLYTSSKARSHHVKWDEIGDGFVRELDFSQITLRLKEKSNQEKDTEVIGHLTGDTMQTLRQCLNNPTVLDLHGPDGSINKIKVSMKFIPVLMDLDPRESINNMGSLRVEIIDGKNLPAADRSGKSDPYASFILNDAKVYKSKIVKKTLNPSWNESFETEITSRVDAVFICKVFDWDMGDKDDYLGQTAIDLSKIEPFQRTEMELPLDGTSGTVRISLLFRPAYITRQRRGTTSFTANPTRIVTGVAAAPIKTVGYAASGVKSGASFLKHGLHRHSKNADSSSNRENTILTSTTANSGDMVRAQESNNTLPLTVDSADEDAESQGVHSASSRDAFGTADIAVLQGKGFPSGAKVQVHVRLVTQKSSEQKTKAIKSSEPEWNETFKFDCAIDQQIQLLIKDHNLFGKDDNLGEKVIVIEDYLAEDPWVDVGHNCQVRIRCTFSPKDNASAGSSPRS